MSKYRPVEGDFSAVDARVAIVVSRWNGQVTGNLENGAVAVLESKGISADNISVYRVPGAFELPVAAQKIASTGKVDGIIALGCVIRGDTPHFDYVCAECTRGIGRVSLDSGVPVGFGLLTCDSLDQALARSGNDRENKGEEAALTVLEMISLLRRIG